MKPSVDELGEYNGMALVLFRFSTFRERLEVSNGKCVVNLAHLFFLEALSPDQNIADSVVLKMLSH